MAKRRDAWVGTLCCMVLVGCVRLDESHCANRDGDASCRLRGDALTICSDCEAANDGCVVGPIAPDCHAAGTSSSSESASVADDAATHDPTDDPSGASGPASGGDGSGGDETTAASTSAGDDTSTGGDASGTATGEASESTTSSESSTTAAEPECGNGFREGEEQCDGEDLDGQTCLHLPGEAGGVLSCDQFCMFNTTQCNDCVTLLGLCAEDSQCCVGHCNLGLCVL